MAGSTCRSVLAAVVARNDGTNGLRQRFNGSTYRGDRLETTLEERGHIILAIVLDIIGKLTHGSWQLPSRIWSVGDAAGSLPSPIPIRQMWSKSTMKLWWFSVCV